MLEHNFRELLASYWLQRTQLICAFLSISCLTVLFINRRLDPPQCGTAHSCRGAGLVHMGQKCCLYSPVVFRRRETKRKTRKGTLTAFPLCIPEKVQGCVLSWYKPVGFISPRSCALLNFICDLESNQGQTQLHTWRHAVHTYTSCVSFL